MNTGKDNNEVDVTIDHEVYSGGNSAQSLESFRDLALGMFIHWSVDSQLGLEISHWMVGASDRVLRQNSDYLMPRFNPRAFDPEQYADLADICGMKYFCFTAKHHSGFCMFQTKTTSFNVMNTPYKMDITRMYIDSFRARGIKVGLYFSPLDFNWLHENSIPIRFLHPTVIPANNPNLMAYNQTQLKELITNYGEVATVFFDGPPEGLKQVVWDLSPHTVITRGEMPTPEQSLPDEPLDQAWEACHTLGEQWNWHPSMLINKSARQLVEMLIETRAKGGNLLLNVTPAPDGSIPQPQEHVLRELGLWLFWNHPAIYQVRPYCIASEPIDNGGRVWYTQSTDKKTVFAFIVDNKAFDRGTRREFRLTAVAKEKIRHIELLGQNGSILEHAPDTLHVAADWRNDGKQVLINAMRALRPCGSVKYNFPYVLRLTLM